MALHHWLGLKGVICGSQLGARLCLERTIPSHQSNASSPRQLVNSVRADLFDEGLNLLFLPGDLDHQLIRADVENPPAKDLHQGVDFGSARGGAPILINIKSRST